MTAAFMRRDDEYISVVRDENVWVWSDGGTHDMAPRVSQGYQVIGVIVQSVDPRPQPEFDAKQGDDDAPWPPATPSAGSAPDPPAHHPNPAAPTAALPIHPIFSPQPSWAAAAVGMRAAYPTALRPIERSLATSCSPVASNSTSNLECLRGTSTTLQETTTYPPNRTLDASSSPTRSPSCPNRA
jgi:hypothetical protein